MDREILLYCRSSRQTYALTLRRDREGRETVVDFRLQEQLDDPLPESQIAAARAVFPMAEGLRGCVVCGSRSTCSCLCLEKACSCENHAGFRSQCVFCRRLERLRDLTVV